MINKCLFGDCRDVLRQMIADGVKVNCVITSPPYWGLRDYGTAKWDGGDSECDHLQQAGIRQDVGRTQISELTDKPFRDHCGKCNANRIDSQLGLEPTLAEFVANMVEVFSLVLEILTDDGVLFMNLGDSYASDSKGSGGPSAKQKSNAGSRYATTKLDHGLKSKDMCGVPWRVAFALQEAGWWLRQDIIWSKLNPMPESVTDRCTKAHEYVFLMTKSARYFFDADAIKEPAVGGAPGNVTHKGKTAYESGDEFMRTKAGLTKIGAAVTRNKRSVWTIPSQAYSGAHFATFPEALVEPMVLAGTSAHGHCPACGKGWVRVLEREFTANGKIRNAGEKGMYNNDGRGDIPRGDTKTSTTGWQPSCDHNIPPVPGIVLDPFFGSGTTGRVAQSLGRNWLGIELNPDYEKLQDVRVTQYGFAL